jgi:hypothetical protein
MFRLLKARYNFLRKLHLLTRPQDTYGVRLRFFFFANQHTSKRDSLKVKGQFEQSLKKFVQTRGYIFHAGPCLFRVHTGTFTTLRSAPTLFHSSINLLLGRPTSISCVPFFRIHASVSMPPFIYINGYPGVGKLTVAKELRYVSMQLPTSLPSFPPLEKPLESLTS